MLKIWQYHSTATTTHIVLLMGDGYYLWVLTKSFFINDIVVGFVTTTQLVCFIDKPDN